jgi:phosphatidylglycerophosphate synthase
MSVVRRQVMAAERTGEGPITVVCADADADAIRAELAGTSAGIDLDPPPEGATVRSCAHFDRKALLRSIYKPTDNWFARLNRRVSIPISSILCRTRISPNAITLIGLVISIASGVAYARGGYAITLLGAFLSWFSSMWDGVDGEIARLTYRESEFGCWLESVCDDLYYGAVFVGLMIAERAVWLGVSALAGIVILFGLHYVLRARVAARTGAAKSFAGYFDERMRELEDDPIVRFARTTYKWGTRSTLPYVLLALALLGQSRLALIIVAVGPHIYWLLTIYVWRAEPAPRRAPSLGPSSVPRRG